MLHLESRAADEVAPAAGVTTVVGIVRDFSDPCLELLRLLREAAEIEHALMVQYLFAAFSVRPDYRDRLAGNGGSGSARSLTGVAIQEMRHLSSVNKLLVALGATPCLLRQDFPYEPEIYPFPFHLERLTPLSVAKYVWAEASVDDLDESHNPGLAGRLRAVLGGDLRLNHLGSIYGDMVERLAELAADPPPRFPNVLTWTMTLNDIRKQGEAAHFEFFKSVFDGTHSAFPVGLDVWALDPDDPRYPSMPVPSDPIAFPTGDTQDPRMITDEPVRRLAWLADLHYWTVLMLLDLSYRYGATTFALAVSHMTDALLRLGFALSDRGHGPAFDVLGMGYAPGLDRAGSIEVVRRIAREAETRAGELAADGLLPPDYDRGLNAATITELEGL